MKFFQWNLNKLKCIVIFLINIDNFKKWKYHILKNALSLSIVYRKCGHEYKKIFKEEESIETLKILGLINKEDSQKIYNHAWKKHEWRT